MMFRGALSMQFKRCWDTFSCWLPCENLHVVIGARFRCSDILVSRTFEAAYVISIILALGIGEILFGRMNRRNALH